MTVAAVLMAMLLSGAVGMLAWVLARRTATVGGGGDLTMLVARLDGVPQALMATREQLAALLGVRLDDLFKRAPRRNAVVITDTRGSWAIPWILPVTRAGVMEVYPNHTFQPSAAVRRGDLAEAASRVLSIIAAETPALDASWRSPTRQFPDVPPAHLGFSAASMTVEV